MALIKKNGIYYRKWAAEKPKAVVLAVHGMGAQSERFADMAKFLKTKKISTYSIALRGYGELAGDTPGHIESMDLYSEDIARLKFIIKKEAKNKPIFILGESMGAMISHMTVLKYDSDYKGLVEIAPVNKDIMNLNTLKIAITAIFKPKQSVLMPFKTEDLTRDKIMVKKLNNDKREIKTASAGLLLGIGIRQLVIPMTIKKIKIPLLMVLAGKDSLGSTPYNIKLFNKFTCDKHLKVYQNSYHALTIDKNREEVFKGIYEWMSKKISD